LSYTRLKAKFFFFKQIKNKLLELKIQVEIHLY